MIISANSAALGLDRFHDWNYVTLNTATNRLLDDLGIRRADTSPQAGSLSGLIGDDLAAISAGVAVANAAVSRNQAADEALATIAEKLQDMRALVDQVVREDLTAEQVAEMEQTYSSLAAEVAELAAIEADGQPLLEGPDALVDVDLAAALELTLSDLPADGAACLTAALADVGLARSDLAGSMANLARTIEDLQGQSESLSALEVQVQTARQAVAVLEGLTGMFFANVLVALEAQARADATEAGWRLA